MTSGKAGGLLGEPLKGADKTMSRLKAAGFASNVSRDVGVQTADYFHA
jgi:hypothetical protein